MSDQTVLAGCIPLAQAESSLEKAVDIVGVIVDFRQPMPSRGTDWTVTFTLCDKSCPLPDAGLCVRIFRPTMELLPKIRSNGDIILLRSVRIKYYGNRLTTMCYSNTSWVISYLPTHPNAIPLTASHPGTSKPRPQDLEYMRSLQKWWSTSEVAPVSSYQTTGVVNDRKRKFSLIRDMKFDCFYDIVGLVVKTFPGHGNFTIYITDYSKNPMLHSYEWGRIGAGGDNDDYDYTGRGRTGGNHKWPGPWGQYTLQVTLWDEHAAAARRTVFEGIYLRLDNVRAKRNGDGKLEGALHGDKRSPDRAHVHVMKDISDPRIRQVIQRSKEYTRRFEIDKLRYEEEMQTKVAEMNQKEVEKQVRKDEGNKNVRCRGSDQPVTPISQILNPTGTAAPFVNRNYRIYCRVIDYLPKNLQDFSVPNDSLDTQPEEEYCEEKKAKPWVWRFALLVEGKDGAAMRVIVEGEDGVHLLKMDPVDLRKNTRVLQILRERLFVLWGSLEERTTHRCLREKKDSRSATTPASNQHRKRNRRSHRSDAKSQKYDELGKPRRRSDADSGSDTDEIIGKDTEDGNSEERCGKMFEACVKEYGVSVRNKWKRMHRLFGTVIL